MRPMMFGGIMIFGKWGCAGMVDRLVLGTSVARHVGSSPITLTKRWLLQNN